MTYGLNFYKQNASLVYSSADVTWNQVDFFLVQANTAGSKDYGSVLSGRTVITTQMFIDPPPVNQKALAYVVTVSGTTVSWSGGNQKIYLMVLMK